VLDVVLGTPACRIRSPAPGYRPAGAGQTSAWGGGRRHRRRLHSRSGDGAEGGHPLDLRRHLTAPSRGPCWRSAAPTWLHAPFRRWCTSPSGSLLSDRHDHRQHQSGHWRDPQRRFPGYLWARAQSPHRSVQVAAGFLGRGAVAHRSFRHRRSRTRKGARRKQPGQPVPGDQREGAPRRAPTPWCLRLVQPKHCRGRQAVAPSLTCRGADVRRIRVSDNASRHLEEMGQQASQAQGIARRESWRE